MGEELLLAEEYLGKARAAWQGSEAPQVGLAELRKVAAILQRCFEHHGCPRRLAMQARAKDPQWHRPDPVRELLGDAAAPMDTDLGAEG